MVVGGPAWVWAGAGAATVIALEGTKQAFVGGVALVITPGGMGPHRFFCVSLAWTLAYWAFVSNFPTLPTQRRLMRIWRELHDMVVLFRIRGDAR